MKILNFSHFILANSTILFFSLPSLHVLFLNVYNQNIPGFSDFVKLLSLS